MPQLTQAQKEFALRESGYDPASYDIDDNWYVTPKVTASSQPAVLSNGLPQPKLTPAGPAPMGMGSTFVKEAIHAAPAAAASGLGAWGGAALGAPFAPVTAGLSIPIGAILGGFGLGMGTSLIQDKIEEAVVPDYVAQRQANLAANPVTGMAARLSTMPLGGMWASPSNVGRAGGDLLSRVTGATSRLNPAQTANLANVGIGAGIGTGIGVGTQLAQGRPLGETLTSLDTLEALIGGAAFNKPNAIGKRYGWHDVPASAPRITDDPRIAAIQAELARNKQETAQQANIEQQQNVEAELLAKQVGQERRMGNTESPQSIMQSVTPPVQRGLIEVAEGKLMRPRQGDLLTAEEAAQKRTPNEVRRAEDFKKAQEELQQQNLREMQIAAELKRRQNDAAEANYAAPAVAPNTLKITKPSMLQADVNRPASFSPDVDPMKASLEDFGRIQRNLEVQNDTQGAEFDAIQDRLERKNQPEEEALPFWQSERERVAAELQHVIDNPVFDNVTGGRTQDNKIKRNKLTAQLKRIDSNIEYHKNRRVNQPEGEAVAEDSELRQAVVASKANTPLDDFAKTLFDARAQEMGADVGKTTEKGSFALLADKLKRMAASIGTAEGADTRAHEVIGHIYNKMLELSPYESDKRIQRQMLKAAAESPELAAINERRAAAGKEAWAPDEFVANQQGLEWLMRNAAGETPNKAWFEQWKAGMKSVMGKANAADLRRLVDYKWHNDAPFAEYFGIKAAGDAAASAGARVNQDYQEGMPELKDTMDSQSAKLSDANFNVLRISQDLNALLKAKDIPTNARLLRELASSLHEDQTQVLLKNLLGDLDVSNLVQKHAKGLELIRVDNQRKRLIREAAFDGPRRVNQPADESLPFDEGFNSKEGDDIFSNNEDIEVNDALPVKMTPPPEGYRRVKIVSKDGATREVFFNDKFYPGTGELYGQQEDLASFATMGPNGLSHGVTRPGDKIVEMPDQLYRRDQPADEALQPKQVIGKWVRGYTSKPELQAKLQAIIDEGPRRISEHNPHKAWTPEWEAFNQRPPDWNESFSDAKVGAIKGVPFVVSHKTVFMRDAEGNWFEKLLFARNDNGTPATIEDNLVRNKAVPLSERQSSPEFGLVQHLNSLVSDVVKPEPRRLNQPADEALPTGRKRTKEEHVAQQKERNRIARAQNAALRHQAGDVLPPEQIATNMKGDLGEMLNKTGRPANENTIPKSKMVSLDKPTEAGKVGDVIGDKDVAFDTAKLDQNYNDMHVRVTQKLKELNQERIHAIEDHGERSDVVEELDSEIAIQQKLQKWIETQDPTARVDLKGIKKVYQPEGESLPADQNDLLRNRKTLQHFIKNDKQHLDELINSPIIRLFGDKNPEGGMVVPDSNGEFIKDTFGTYFVRVKLDTKDAPSYEPAPYLYMEQSGDLDKALRWQPAEEALPATIYERTGAVGKGVLHTIGAEVDKLKAISPAAGKGTEDFLTALRARRGELEGSFNYALRQVRKAQTLKEYWFQDNPDYQKVVQWRDALQDGDAEPFALTPVQQKVNEVVDANLKRSLDTRESYKKEGDIDGLARGTAGKKFYLPHVMARDAAKALAEYPTGDKTAQLLKDFIAYRTEKSGQTAEEARADWKTIRESFNMVEEGNIASRFGAIDKALGKGLPKSMREQNLMDRMGRFNRRFARRVAFHEAIQRNSEARDAFFNSEKGVASTTVGKNILRDMFGIREHTEATRSAASGIVRALMLGPLTGAKDIVSGQVLGLQHMGLEQVLPAKMEAFAKFGENYKKSIETGVVRNGYGGLESGEGGLSNVQAVMERSRDVINQVQGRQMLETVSRVMNYGEGRFLAADAFRAIENGRLSAQQRGFLDDFVPNWQELKNKPVDDKVLDEAAARFVESVQGTYDYRGLPSVAMQGTFSPYLSLARWNIEKFNNFTKKVVDPATKGNYQPLLMATLGAFIGGTAVNALVEEVTGRKERTAKWDEIAASKEQTGLIGYKLAALASMSGYGGILGDIVKSGFDAKYKNRVQTFSNPLIDAGATVLEDTKFLVQAMEEGDLPAVTDVLHLLATDYIQAYRIALPHVSGEKKKELEATNKRRDLKVWKMGEGEELSAASNMRPNPLVGKAARQFKQTDDMQEAAGLVPELVDKAIAKATIDGTINPEILKEELSKYKRNSYQTVPNPEQSPISATRYIDFLSKTQGRDEASRRIEDYMRRNAINKAKSSMIPTIQ